MIEIRKVIDPLLINKICKSENIEFNSKDHIIATIENEKILQCAVFSYDNNEGNIKVISGFEGDMNLLDGLCRAILNIMDINGVKVVYLSDKYHELADLIGFEKSECGYFLKLEGFFNCCCNHKQ